MKTRKSRLTVSRFPFPVSGEPGVEPLNLENEKGRLNRLAPGSLLIAMLWEKGDKSIGMKLC
jgi:hypothetical protein